MSSFLYTVFAMTVSFQDKTENALAPAAAGTSGLQAQ